MVGAGVAKADSVVYTLTGSTNPAFGPVHTESFQFTAPGFIASYTDLFASQLPSCVACASSGIAVEFYPNGTLPIVIPVDLIRFTDANGIVYGFFFAPGAFSAPGTYITSDHLPYIESNIGTLDVQVAEPSSLLLLVCSTLALAGAVQAKRLFLA